MASLRVGLIGCGNISQAHMAGWVQVKEAKVVACCDALPERAQARSAQFGIEKVYATYQDLLAQSDVDAVDLCLPHFLHAPVAIAAAQAGKHILVEKPITTTLDEAKSVIQACDAAGVKLMVEYPMRFSPRTKLLKSLIAEGIIGKVITVMQRILEPKNIVAQSQRGYVTGDMAWKLDPQLSGGGALHRDGCHATDFLRWITGMDVTRVYAEMDNYVWDTEIETTANVLLRFDNGAIGELDVVWCALMPSTRSTIVLGTKGSIQSDRDGDVELYCSDSQVLPQALNDLIQPFGLGSTYAPARVGSGILIRPSSSEPEGIAGAVAHFTDCVLNDQAPISSGIDGLKALEIVIGAYRSVEEGKAVRLPLITL